MLLTNVNAKNRHQCYGVASDYKPIVRFERLAALPPSCESQGHRYRAYDHENRAADQCKASEILGICRR